MTDPMQLPSTRELEELLESLEELSDSDYEEEK